MDIVCVFGLCGEKMTWNLEGDILFIDGEGKMDNYLRNGSIWKSLAWEIRSVVISRGVTSIGDYAFCGFTNLTSVSIPESVTEIGAGAFADCTSLQEITIPWRNDRYFFLDGMLIDKHIDLPVWPPEKAGKPVCRFSVNENDCVFHIDRGRYSQEGRSEIACFGDSYTLIEIKESCGAIIDIACIYLKPTLRDPNLVLPNYRYSPHLTQTDEINCFTYISGEKNPCVVNIARNRVEIILSENFEDICCYYKEGRVEYYCDEANEVVFFRVVDLTEEEYEFLNQQDGSLAMQYNAYISKLVMYGPDALVREKMATLEAQYSAYRIYEEQCGNNLAVYLADIQWLNEKVAYQLLAQLKWAAFVLNFSDNTLQTIASKAGNPAVDFRQTLCPLFEDSTFLITNDPEYYQQSFRDIFDSRVNPLIEDFLRAYPVTDRISRDKTVFPNRIWYTKEYYDGRSNAAPPHLPDWWSIDETGKMELRLLDRMTLPNCGVKISCENSVLSDLMKKHGFPDDFDFPTGRMYGIVDMRWEESNIRVFAQPSKSPDLDYDDRDFFGLFSLDAVMATMLTCLKDVLASILKIKLGLKISDSMAFQKAITAAVLTFEEDYLHYAGAILRSFTQLDCDASYVTHTNDYFEPMDGFCFFGKLDKDNHEMQYTSWIEGR